MNCPRCNAALNGRVSCPKCGKICRSEVPRRLRKMERRAKNIETWSSSEFRRKAAREALEGERFLMGEGTGGVHQATR